ncbi:class I SAM-dependent DNA methyltransferase [Celeribacter persicus]|uniref:Methyltransferase family protein n=1 Tax=Celeribacter persicus TaxID=1651082 RepID=A0A2T5HT58_9RHOB|nr:class I SAM-dependent methyltransferase [Celeribacter persicus]PTQ74773.1 methyltransferase family protein [Celeribacter persicus]
MSEADRTIPIYDAQAGAYAVRNAELYELPQAQAFAGGLPSGAHILDFGCGPGQYAEWFATQGFEVEAWDASAEMLALTARHEGVATRLARFDALEAKEVYDGIWANFSLLHAERQELPDLLHRIHRALKPGGVFHIAMKLGEGAGPDKLGRYYTYYGEAELEDLLHAARFTVQDRRLFGGVGLDGTAGHYITLLCHG